nr:MAG TPA: hypothetical protein [Caudoviricetes sp.]
MRPSCRSDSAEGRKHGHQDHHRHPRLRRDRRGG